MAEEQKSPQEQETLLWVDEKGKIIEPVFADYFLSLHPMKCFHDKLFTVDGIIDDESGLKSEIYGLIRRYVTSSVARKIDMLPSSCPASPTRRKSRPTASMWQTALTSQTDGFSPKRNTA